MSGHRIRTSLRFWRSETHLRCSCGWTGYSFTGHIWELTR